MAGLGVEGGMGQWAVGGNMVGTGLEERERARRTVHLLIALHQRLTCVSVHAWVASLCQHFCTFPSLRSDRDAVCALMSSHHRLACKPPSPSRPAPESSCISPLPRPPPLDRSVSRPWVSLCP